MRTCSVIGCGFFCMAFLVYIQHATSAPNRIVDTSQIYTLRSLLPRLCCWALAATTRGPRIGLSSHPGREVEVLDLRGGVRGA
jgi:hypothetical protein